MTATTACNVADLNELLKNLTVKDKDETTIKILREKLKDEQWRNALEVVALQECTEDKQKITDILSKTIDKLKDTAELKENREFLNSILDVLNTVEGSSKDKIKETIEKIISDNTDSGLARERMGAFLSKFPPARTGGVGNSTRMSL